MATPNNVQQIDLEKGETNDVRIDGDLKIAATSKRGSCPIPFPFPCPLGLPLLLPFLVTGIMIIVGIG